MLGRGDVRLVGAVRVVHAHEHRGERRQVHDRVEATLHCLRDHRWVAEIPRDALHLGVVETDEVDDTDRIATSP